MKASSLRSLATLAVVSLLAFAPGCALESEYDPDEETDVDETESENVDTIELGLTGAFDGTAETTQAGRINRRRERLGRRKLNRRTCLNTVARRWSAKMASNNTLAHNPNLAAQVSNKCGAVGLRWRGLAENVGVGFSELSVWQAFIDSSAHRANIDKAAWDSMGIGIYKRSDGKMFFTQVFADF